MNVLISLFEMVTVLIAFLARGSEILARKQGIVK
jgi:hypothetical protein